MPLLEWLFELREGGVPVNVRAMVFKDELLDTEFAQSCGLQDIRQCYDC